jgi:hypothetical protein
VLLQVARRVEPQALDARSGVDFMKPFRPKFMEASLQLFRYG